MIEGAHCFQSRYWLTEVMTGFKQHFVVKEILLPQATFKRGCLVSCGWCWVTMILTGSKQDFVLKELTLPLATFRRECLVFQGWCWVAAIMTGFKQRFVLKEFLLPGAPLRRGCLVFQGCCWVTDILTQLFTAKPNDKRLCGFASCAGKQQWSSVGASINLGDDPCYLDTSSMGLRIKLNFPDFTSTAIEDHAKLLSGVEDDIHVLRRGAHYSSLSLLIACEHSVKVRPFACTHSHFRRAKDTHVRH